MSVQLNDLGSALTAQIYEAVMGGDEKVPPPKDTFFTWVTPGLPLSESDVDFCSDGIFSAPTAEETRARITHAFALAMLLDYVPDVDAPYSSEKQAGMFKPDAEKRLSETYRQILRFSKVVDKELSHEEQEKLERFRKLLTTTRKVKDLITDEEKEITEEGPVLKAYNEKMQAYVAAAMSYNAKRVAAASTTGPEGKAAVLDFTTNGQLYALQVKAAADAWVASGFRNEVDQMNAFIGHVTQRSMVAWKQQLLEAYDKSEITSPEIPIPFRYTTLVPGDFAKSTGWTNLKVTQESVEWSKKNVQTSWKAGAKASFGLFSVGGAGGQASSHVDENHRMSSFSLSFDMAQVMAVRPWFFADWFASRGWTLGEGWTFDGGRMPSDGGSPPQGSLIGYATQVIFARNVEIRSADFVSAYQKASSQVTGGGSVGWGPFSLGGSYSRGKQTEKFTSTIEGGVLKVPGMQIIGFVNHLIGKSPNPAEGLTEADFV